MLCVGLLYALLAVAGDSPAPALLGVHTVYYALLVGTAALTWGTARSSVNAVFFAVGAMGVMGVVLLVQTGRLVRRARDRGPTLAALRLALCGFFLVASLGIWLAHGHGGMQFPGPRPLWLQVHLSAGLCGWVGAVLMAASWHVVPIVHRGVPVSPRVAAVLHACVGFGIAGPCALLLADYFGLIPANDWNREAWAAGLGLPAFVAVWFAHPVIALWSVRGGTPDAGLSTWRTALGFGPCTGIAGVTAFFMEDPRFALLFGWLAIFGWAGLALHALLLRVMPFLIVPTHRREGGMGRLWIESRIAQPLMRIPFALHLAALVVGSVGIVGRRDILIRIAGLMMVGLGISLLALYTASMRRPAPPEVAG
jgi:hypothetical protein